MEWCKETTLELIEMLRSSEAFQYCACEIWEQMWHQ